MYCNDAISYKGWQKALHTSACDAGALGRGWSEAIRAAANLEHFGVALETK